MIEHKLTCISVELWTDGFILNSNVKSKGSRRNRDFVVEHLFPQTGENHENWQPKFQKMIKLFGRLESVISIFLRHLYK